MHNTYFVVMDTTDPNNVGIHCPEFDVTSCGESREDAKRMVTEAVGVVIDDMIQAKMNIPKAQDSNALLNCIDQLKEWGVNKENITVETVRITLPEKALKTKQIAVTMPEKALEEIDSWRKAHKIPRSRLITEATLEYIHSH